MAVLPEKWRIKRTRENADIVNDYLNNLNTTTAKYSTNNTFAYSHPINGRSHVYSEADGFTIGKAEDFTEISFEDFKELVLNKSVEPKIVDNFILY